MLGAASCNRVRRVLAPALLAALGTLGLTACGSSGPTGYHNPKYPYGAPNVPFSMSKCMRAHGVSDFPDPRSGPDGGGVGWPGGGPVMISSDVLLIMGQRFAGPAVATAGKACKEYMAPSGPGPSMTEAQREAAINDAACMRAHGIHDFPDPTFTGGGQQLNLAPGINPQSPAVEQASKACGLLRP
ncbi:MAG TPA: hypothetical protein VMD48_07405 [Solirubrobacteraceae bacterium]|nr:hypothetical protein [Solirubrobacteraceae bacterium]